MPEPVLVATGAGCGEAGEVSSIRQTDHIKRVRGGQGFLSIDNRLSDGELTELPTLTCCHCNRVVVLNPLRTRERGYCQKCNAYRCDSCVTCTPIAQLIEFAIAYPDVDVLTDCAAVQRLQEKARLF